MRAIFFCLIAFIFLSGIACRPVENSTDIRVKKIIDGDTIDVQFPSGAVERVRLIGIDTPETVDPRRPVQCFGKEASAHLKKIIAGVAVQLESEPQNQDRDKYGRLLRYVFLTDGTFINEQMVREGYAYAYTRFPFAFAQRFARTQRDARIAQRGLWSPLTCDGKR